MQSRYALRFENGERKGETLPITGSGITVGRKPGNSVQILDASVSGRHAEFLVEEDGILLRDLGSTNGTRVGNDRVSERKVAHGDAILLGNVRLTLLDTELDAPPAEEFDLEASAPAAATADAVRTISADKVARTGKRSIVGALGLVLTVVVAGAVWWYLRPGGPQGPTTARKSVEPVEGNLLASGYSFETDGAGWENDEAAAGSFELDGGSRRSGESGLGAIVAEGEWALARSAKLRSGSHRALSTQGWLRLDGAVEARLGLELEHSGGAAARTFVWSDPITSTSSFEPVEVVSAIPPCFDAVRVVAFARGLAGQGGSVDVDDVALLAASDVGAPEAFNEFQLFLLGQPATAAVLFKIDRTLLSDMHVLRGEGVFAERVALGAAQGETGLALELGSGPGRTLSMRVEEALLKGGSGTLGEGGYRSHTGELTREGVTALFAGSGTDRTCVRFDSPVTVKGRAEGGQMRLELALGANTSARLQLSFLAEREEAQRLATAARDAQRNGRLGQAAADWARLRDEVPFEPTLLAEAETARVQIAEAGSNETRELRRRVERARFFRLLDLYRRCRDEAQALATRYAGTDVEAEARALVEEVSGDLAELEVDLDRAERARLEGIAASLEASGSERLAGRVREYLAEHFARAGGAANGGR